MGRGEKQPSDLSQRLGFLLPQESRTMETTVCRETMFYLPGITDRFGRY